MQVSPFLTALSSNVLIECVVTPLNTITPLFPDTLVFLKILLNATFPLPHGVSPIPFPLRTSFEGTHGTAPRGDTLGTRIDMYRSLIMPLVRQRKEQHSLAHLYSSSSLALDAVGALRLQLRMSTFR